MNKWNAKAWGHDLIIYICVYRHLLEGRKNHKNSSVRKATIPDEILNREFPNKKPDLCSLKLMFYIRLISSPFAQIFSVQLPTDVMTQEPNKIKILLWEASSYIAIQRLQHLLKFLYCVHSRPHSVRIMRQLNPLHGLLSSVRMHFKILSYPCLNSGSCF